MLINPIKSYYGVSETTAMMAPGIGMLGYSIGGLVGGALLAVIGNRQEKFKTYLLQKVFKSDLLNSN